jgi:hypothetical protein
MNDWTALNGAGGIPALLGIETSMTEDDLADLLMLLPDRDAYIALDNPQSSAAPTGPAFRLQVPGTRLFINLNACRELKGDILLAFLLWGWSQNLPLSVLMASVRKLGNNLRLLSEDESEVVGVIARLANGDAYGVGVPIATLADAYADASIDLAYLLDSLENKLVITRDRQDQIRLVW